MLERLTDSWRAAALIAALVLLVSSPAQAQTTFNTGSLNLLLDDSETTLHTYASHVPEDAADNATSPEQRAILEKVAGTDQHTATFMRLGGISVGGVQITTPTLHVSMYFRDEEERSSGVGGVDIEFALDPETLELIPAEDLDVKYLPTGSSFDDYYALTQGELAIDSVEVVDEQTLAISGRFSGVLSLQEGFLVAHNPDDTLRAEGTFVVDQVVGSAVLLELLDGE